MGDKVITLKLNLTDYSTVYARAAIAVVENSDLLKSVTIGGFHDDYPCEDEGIVPNENSSFILYGSGSNDNVNVKIWYGNNSSGQTKTLLTKPVVIVDGFDPIPLKFADRSAEEIYFETNFDKNYNNSGCENVEDEDRMEDIDEGLIDRLKIWGTTLPLLILNGVATILM